MKKKIILGLGAVAIVIAGVASFSAWEAHIINVTAHIENALAVSPDALDFGTVFPQEYLLSNPFTVGLSQSFLDQEDAYRVDYVIKQKTKCVCNEYGIIETICNEGDHAPIGWDTHQCPDGFEAMLSLCPYLSKVSLDDNTISHPSYFQNDHCYPVVKRELSAGLNYGDGGWGGWSCPGGTIAVAGGVHYAPEGFNTYASGLAKYGTSVDDYDYPVYPHYTYNGGSNTPGGEEGFVLRGGPGNGVILYVDCQTIVPDASGILTLGVNNSHSWTVDLKVPPFDGYVGQDWPAGCPVLMDADPTGTDMGCDLWIEVTNIRRSSTE